MHVQFWGVRGSLPTPLSPQQIRSKISAIVQRISPEDLLNEDTRQHFINSLPENIGSTVGGNTACVEVINGKGTVFILDAGTGIRLLGKKHAAQKTKVFHMFFSHFHWDHIQGLPFFDPIYNPNNEIHIYTPETGAEQYLRDQMETPYFPAPLSSCTKKLYFHYIKPGDVLNIDGTTIECRRMFHPGGSHAYSFVDNGKKFIYATDVELQAEDYAPDNPNASFFSNADALVLDAQYTVEEVIAKENWGHSSFSHATDFATAWKVKDMYMFHHDPTYDDKKILTIQKTAEWYMKHNGSTGTQVHIASEGMEFVL